MNREYRRNILNRVVEKLLLIKPIKTLLILVLLQTFFIFLQHQVIHKSFHIIFGVLTFSILLLFAITAISMVVRGFTKLRNPDSIKILIEEYILFIVGILLIFTAVLTIIQNEELGFLKYGECSINGTISQQNTTSDADVGEYNNISIGEVSLLDLDDIVENKESFEKNEIISTDYFYFSAITFFGIGYGDICPTGRAKYVAIIIAFVSHLISVVFIGLILNNYLNKKNANKN